MDAKDMINELQCKHWRQLSRKQQRAVDSISHKAYRWKQPLRPSETAKLERFLTECRGECIGGSRTPDGGSTPDLP